MTFNDIHIGGLAVKRAWTYAKYQSSILSQLILTPPPGTLDALFWPPWTHKHMGHTLTGHIEI